MSKTTAPVPATTDAGNPLPFVALPQGQLLSVQESAIPMLKDAKTSMGGERFGAL